jgi:predicted deacylase
MVAQGFLSVVCQGHSLELPVRRFTGEAETETLRILIVAGIHGRENGGIQTAYALLDRLAEISDFRGVIDVLPVANPAGFAAETRDNPVDGKNLGECFSEFGVDHPNRNGSSQTEGIARSILARLDGCAHLLDLHSAGEARYLPHAIFFRKEDARSAAAAGLPFALLRTTTREGAKAGMLCQAALERGIPALALELGGGITTWPEDVDIGIRAILSLLAYWKYISPGYGSDPTQPEPSDKRGGSGVAKRRWYRNLGAPEDTGGDSRCRP